MPSSASLVGFPSSRVLSRTLHLIAGVASTLLVAAVAPGPAGANVAASASSQLTCDGRQPTIFAGPASTGKVTGTNGDDVIVVVSDRIAWSGNSRQVIDAKMGDDLVCTFGGWNYQVDGGPGHDRIWTEAGDDHISGGMGRDKMRSGAGNDMLDGGRVYSFGDDAYCGDGVDTVEDVALSKRIGCELDG